LLNTIRSKGLVSAERRRELAKRWSVEQENRDLILEEIERIMEEHSRHLMKDY
jgi:nucleoside-triphosphatase THEP1